MRNRLMDIYERLLDEFGPCNWWPAKTSFEVMVGAILTQNTAWGNVEKAIGKLIAADVLTPKAISTLPVDELEQLIKPSGYFRQKAERLQLFSRFLVDRHEGDLNRLFSRPLGKVRQELLAQKGVGPETADSMLLYAGHFPSFVVDAYTIRTFSRLGILSGQENYADIRSFFMSHLPHDTPLFNEYHALIVEHGKTLCKKRTPICSGCPLRENCYYSNNFSQQKA